MLYFSQGALLGWRNGWLHTLFAVELMQFLALFFSIEASHIHVLPAFDAIEKTIRKSDVTELTVMRSLSISSSVTSTTPMTRGGDNNDLYSPLFNAEEERGSENPIFRR